MHFYSQKTTGVEWIGLQPCTSSVQHPGKHTFQNTHGDLEFHPDARNDAIFVQLLRFKDGVIDFDQETAGVLREGMVRFMLSRRLHRCYYRHLPPSSAIVLYHHLS